MDIRMSLEYHLTGNHYPPVPVSMVEPCYKAINFCIAEGEGDGMDTLVELPEGMVWRGQGSAPAREIVEAFHLDIYLQPEFYDY